MENSKNTQILTQLKQNFENKNFDEVISLIEQNKESFDPGIYEYNIGIAYFKKGNLVDARVWFEKAKLKGFYSNELMTALKDVTSKLEVKRLEESQSIHDSFSNISTLLPVDVYVTLSLIFFVILGVFYKKMDKYIRLVVLVLAFMPLAFYFMYAKNYHSIIVLEDQIVFRGPSEMFEQTQLIPKGMKLITGKTHNGWRYILSPESHKGWFKSTKVEKL